MKPLLYSFHILGREFDLYSYSFFLKLGIAVFFTLSFCLAGKKGLDRKRVLIFLLLTALSIPLGARLFHLMLNPAFYLERPSALFSLTFQNFALYGGIMLACLTGYIYTTRSGLDRWKLADVVAAPIGLGIAFARLGCFLNGCCFGKVTGGLIGISFPPGSPAHFEQIGEGLVSILSPPLPVYPTQLIELSGALAGALISLYLIHTRLASGSSFLFFGAFFSLVRMLSYFLRVYPEYYGMPAWFYPVFYLAIISFCMALFYFRNGKIEELTVNG